jgi:hypothetical protein
VLLHHVQHRFLLIVLHLLLDRLLLDSIRREIPGYPLPLVASHLTLHASRGVLRNCLHGR